MIWRESRQFFDQAHHFPAFNFLIVKADRPEDRLPIIRPVKFAQVHEPSRYGILQHQCDTSHWSTGKLRLRRQTGTGFGMGEVDRLLKVEDEEHGGETAFDRLDFQTCWGIARVIELHSATGSPPYAVAFEFHEDIAEVDSVADPSFLRLYQLKTKKKGGWTLASISRPGKDSDKPKPSHIGRMHANLRKFDEIAEKTVFVSNQPLSEAKGAAGEFSFGKADSKALKKFLETIALERPSFSEKDDLPRFRYLDAGLHLDTYHKTVVGQIALFLATEIGGDVDAKQFFLTLGFECRERSKTMADLTSIADLVASKFVTREDIEADLERIRVGRIRRPRWEDVALRLGLHHAEERIFREAWLEYELIKIARPSSAMRKLAADIKAKVAATIDLASNVMEGARSAGALVRPQIEVALGPRSETFHTAAALYEYYS